MLLQITTRTISIQKIFNKFIRVSFGYLGSIHDARVLRLSGLFHLRETNNFNITKESCQWNRNSPSYYRRQRVSTVEHVEMACQPYPSRGHLTPNEREFNEKLSAARSVVERVFGMLKGRWRLLLKEVEQQTRTLSKLFLLHVFHITFVSITATCTIAAIAIQMTVILTTIMKDHCARAAQK